MSYTILAIDDEPSTLSILQIMLELDRPSWKFLAAYDGEAGIKIAERERIDFVLLDIMMPGLNGFETCRHLRALPHMADVPIVMFTALDTPERREQANLVGANDFWIKPFQPGVFIAQMEKILTPKPA